MFRGLAPSNAVPPEYEALVQPHIESYDHFIDQGMQEIVEQLDPIEARLPPPRPSRKRALPAREQTFGKARRVETGAACCCRSRTR